MKYINTQIKLIGPRFNKNRQYRIVNYIYYMLNDIVRIDSRLNLFPMAISPYSLRFEHMSI